MSKITIECTVVYEVACKSKGLITDDRIKEIINKNRPFSDGTIWDSEGTIDYRTNGDKFKINSITRH